MYEQKLMWKIVKRGQKMFSEKYLKKFLNLALYLNFVCVSLVKNILEFFTQLQTAIGDSFNFVL